MPDGTMSALPWAAAGLALVVLMALLGAAVVQTVLARRDRRRLRLPGRLVNGLHVREIGDDGPGVVFEAGIAATSLNWTTVQARLASIARVRSVSYDRAGLGASRPLDGPCTLGRLTDDLHALVHDAGVPRPFVLVAHSFGAYIARVYASRFPADIAALVLVDPATTSEWSHVDDDRLPQRRLMRARVATRITGALAAIGVVRLGVWGLLRRGAGNPGPILGLNETLRRIATETGKLPPDALPVLRARWSERRFFTTLSAYLRALPACAREAARHPFPAGLHVVVLSGAHQPPDRLAEHAAMSTRHVVVPDTGHWLLLDRPDVVVDAIRESLARNH